MVAEDLVLGSGYWGLGWVQCASLVAFFSPGLYQVAQVD